RRGLVAIAESRVAAAEIGVALAQGRVFQMARDGDGIDQCECLPKLVRGALLGQRLAITQMRMHIHQADLAAEEGRGLRSPEQFLYAAGIGQWLIHQADAVWKEEPRGDQGEMVSGLLRCEERAENGLRHRDQRQGDAGSTVTWMEKQLHV